MTSTGTLTSLAVRAGGTLVRQLKSVIGSSNEAPPSSGTASGWLVVTVCCEPDEIDIAALPAPLAEFGNRIEVRVHRAPDGKGTELATRLRNRPPSGSAASRLSGTDPEADLRSALRRAKQLIEVGEVLAVDPTPHGKRTASPGGALLEAWTKAAPKAGVR